MGDLKLTNKGSGIFLNNCIRKGRHAMNAQRLHFYQSPTITGEPRVSVRTVSQERSI
ncbi:hypothetical protein KP13_01222 [Klebsiella pneumoniae subsp. pneumoniae Kp13]|nr:hypothetical protein KP13_01222 [Klebsiella pneumoniae subsp. pneumoniae Kp13]